MPDKQDIGEFTKQVAQQLKAGHKVSAEFVSKAVDKHGQDKGIIKIGDSELWLRYDNGGVMVDKIKDGKSIWNTKIDSPVCHLRTSKSIVDKQAGKDVDGEKLARKFHDLYEKLAPSFDYETKKETRQFDPKSNNGRLMIAVCSEILKDFEQDKQTEKDVAEGVVFGDEAKIASEASMRSMKKQEVDEGLSNDSSMGRKLRKTIKQIHHQEGDDKIRLPHPEDAGIIKRDKSEKDSRIKSRQAQNKEAKSEDVAHKILQLLDGNTQVLAESTIDELGFMLRIVDKMGSRTEFADRTKTITESINLAITNRKADDVLEIERFIACLREKRK